MYLNDTLKNKARKPQLELQPRQKCWTRLPLRRLFAANIGCTSANSAPHNCRAHWKPWGVAFVVAAFCALPHAVMAQDEPENKGLTLRGSIQTDMLVPENDKQTGATKANGDFLNNTYVELGASLKNIDVGLRLEYLQYPLPGFEPDFKGWGVPHYYIKWQTKRMELTAGTFYEQFGSGFVLRTYEERSLGIDNSLLGGRLKVNPLPGVFVKALAGKQRRYWEHNDDWVAGGDLELNIEQWLPSMQEHDHYLMLGASVVNKNEPDEVIMTDASHRLRLPRNVMAYDVRARWQHGAYNVLAEYAQKGQDPTADNGYIYRHGYVAMLSGSYSKQGLSLLLQAKRSVNMGFRSRRSMMGTSSFINHLPAFTLEHTYALPAMRPYATQPLGEWAYQASLGYKLKKGTALGGRYGTALKLNFSHVHGIDQNVHGTKGTDGYGSAFWAWGDATYYQDLNLQMEKQWSHALKTTLMYTNQRYNKTVVEGEGGMIHANIFVADVKWKMSPRTTLRTEAQYLQSKDDDSDWLFGLLELSLAPSWMFTVSDQYNSGSTRTHYYQALVTFSHGAHRLQVGYGRTKDGYNCSGGVCRYIPATKGATLSYSYNF